MTSGTRDDATLAAAMAAVVGPAQVLRQPEDLARYGQDGRGSGAIPAMVVRPASADEVSAIVRIAAAQGVRLVVQGGRTGLVGAGLVAQGGIAISLERLAGPPEIDPINRSATVDAGVALSTLNAAAAAHGLYFPIDLGADPSIGGMVAANTGGARLLRYGDVRRNLLGVHVVMADAEGTRMQFGKPLWKNSAGLDLKQLFAGSAGALGIVTRATVALQPLPAHRVTALLSLRSEDLAPTMLVALEAALGTLITAFEGMSQAALAAALRHVPRLRDPFGGQVPAYALLVELSAGQALPAERLEEMLAAVVMPFMDGDDAAIIDIAIDHGEGLWAIRHAIPEGLRAMGTVVACDIAMRRGDVIRFRREAIALLADALPGLIPHDFGHIGDGGLHFNMVWPSAAGPLDPAIADRARDLVFGLVVDTYGGSFSAEHGVGPRNARWYARHAPPAERELAGRVQALIAPAGLGRMDFGMADEA